MNEPFKLTISVAWWMKFILTIPSTAISLFALFQVFMNVDDAFWGFISFGFLAILGWANALSSIQITEKAITVTVFYGRFRIYWDEIQKISFYKMQSGRSIFPVIALIGNNKRVVLSLTFADNKQAKMMAYIKQQIDYRKIIVENGVAYPITHQNARVWL